MVSLEQIRQLETKIGKAIDYVNRVNGENVRLRGELDGSEKRVAELEAVVQRFREEQGRIEEGILAALDKLDQFEDVVNRGFSNVQAVVAAVAPAVSAHTAPAPTGEQSSGDTPQEDVLPGGEPPPDDAPLGDAPPDEEPSDAELPDGESSDRESSDRESSDRESADGESAPSSEETGSEELDIF